MNGCFHERERERKEWLNVLSNRSFFLSGISENGGCVMRLLMTIIHDLLKIFSFQNEKVMHIEEL